MLIAACGDSDDSEESNANATAAETSQVDPETVQIGNLLSQIRGHNAVALERLEAGDTKAANKHAKHPGEEVLDSVMPEIEEISPQAAQTLQSLVSKTDVSGDHSDAHLRSDVEKVSEATQRAEKAVAGDAYDTPSYRGSVVAALLDTAAHEYDEALSNGQIELLAEYQDGYGFLTEARRMYGEIEEDVKSASAEEAEEIDEAFEDLDRAFPSGAEPKNPASIEDVERATGLVAAELSETVDALVPESAEAGEVAERIEELLKQIAREYDPAQPDATAELAAEAYLENYEVIEPDVIEKAPEVNAKLEPLLGAELRKRIREGAPQAEIESMTEEAQKLLDQAVARLEGS